MSQELASHVCHTIARRQVDAPRIAVQGVLYVDEFMHVTCDKMEFVRAVAAGAEKLQFPWRTEASRIGGMPSHMIRSAAAKRLPISLRARLPQRLPQLIHEFLDRNSVDLTEVDWDSDALLSRTLQMQFKDGQVLVVHSAPGAYDLSPPSNDYDLLLINPGSKFSRRPILKQLHDRASPALVGIMARGDWNADDFRQLDRRHAVFLNLAELQQASKQLTRADPTDAAATLKAIGDLTRAAIFVTLGEFGCIVMTDGVARRVDGAQVPVKSLVGVGDTFCFTTCLALLEKKSPDFAAALGNLDAARVVSGEAPAPSLDALLEMLQRHPEVVAPQREPWTDLTGSPQSRPT